MGSLILHLPVAGGVGRSRSGRVDLCKGNLSKSDCILRWTKKSGDGFRRLISKAASASPSPPWLMLPPGRDSSSGDIIHNFYSLSDQKHLTFAGGFAFEDGMKFVGSSNGWLAVFNKFKNHLFLTDPLSGRRIDLPPLDKLHLNPSNVVSKVVLSCSPDAAAEECSALMAFGPEKRLALCSVARGGAWTPIGDANYEDLTYSPWEQSFICAPRTNFPYCTEYWYVGDEARVPELTSIYRPEIHLAAGLGEYSFYTTHVVNVEKMNQELYVVRYVLDDKTIGFRIFRVDYDQGLGNRLSVVVPERDSLNGLAIFIGINHSFAVRAANFRKIKSNSIYFSSPDCVDIGIFGFKKQTITHCFLYPYPSRVERIATPPLWFTPSRGYRSSTQH